MGKYDHEIENAASILSQSTNAAVTSGAGVSAESGIPTFRDSGGLWDQMDPVEAGTPDNFFTQLEQNTHKLKSILTGLLDAFDKADPNPGHRALANLEEMGILKTVITQNIDNLHREAGNTDVVEVHGNLFRMRCLSCGEKDIVGRKSFIEALRNKLKSIISLDFANVVSLAQTCSKCGSVMRPDVVMFGEEVQEISKAFDVAQHCDAMLVLGTSGVVYPAAYLPVEAKNAGTSVIVINPKVRI